MPARAPNCASLIFDVKRSFPTVTKEQFIENREAADRAARRHLIICGALFLCVVVLPVFICVRVGPNIYGLVVCGFQYAGLLGIGFFMGFAGKRRIRRYGLVCPACDKPLTLTAAKIAIATDKCAHCGATVFSLKDERV